MIDRRKFLQLPLAGVPMMLFGKVTGQKAVVLSTGSPRSPVIISTWEAGVTANNGGWPVLQKGGRALDAVEAAGRASEDEPSCCVGLSAWPDRDGKVTLDSSIMDGNGDCGGVSFLERIKHPVSVARKVMEKTPHVLLSGVGAQKFAVANGFPLENGKLSQEAEKEWKAWLKESKYKPWADPAFKPARGAVSQFAPMQFSNGLPTHDTMGTVALDSTGKLAGMVTTSGLAFKMRGRVGDSPVIGAGLFVDNEVGAATSSGVGEEVIRICGTHTVIEQMRMGRTPDQACKEAVKRIVKRDPEKAREIQVGFLALSKTGEFGSFAISPGFAYAVRSADFPRGRMYAADSWF